MSSIVRNILIKLLRRPASRYLKELHLSKSDVAADPFVLFTEWFELAKQIDPDWANTLTLSTASTSAAPSNRIVLLKEYDHNGFVFYTNYASRKSRELEENPQASMVFWWKELYRQIRIEGTVERVSESRSDAYFESRPRGSRIGAWASKQSSTIFNRQVLVDRVKKAEKKYKNTTVPRPSFWGGYRLKPHVIEFWQAREDRLHDRIRYRTNDLSENEGISADSWTFERLSP